MEPGNVKLHPYNCHNGYVRSLGGERNKNLQGIQKRIKAWYVFTEHNICYLKGLKDDLVLI